MSQPLILAKSPQVIFNLQSRYPDAKMNIQTLCSFARKTAWPFENRLLAPVERLEKIKTLRKELFKNQKMPQGFDLFSEELIDALSQTDIAPEMFKEAVEQSNITSFRKEVFLAVSRLYEAYKNSNESMDIHGLFREAAQKVKPPGFQHSNRALVLAHGLTFFEQAFLKACSNKNMLVDQLSAVSHDSKGRKLDVFRVGSVENEIEVLVTEIKKKISQGTLERSIYVFCFNFDQVKNILESRLEKAGINFSFWQGLKDSANYVSILPWHANHLVFSDMEHVFLSGVSDFKALDSAMLEEEKALFNQLLKKTVFPIFSDEKEQVKQLLDWLAHRCNSLTLLGSSHLPLVFREFLKEYPKHKTYDLPPSNFKKAQKKLFKEKPAWHQGLTTTHGNDLLPKTYSVSAFNQYQNCPYGFLMRSCLKLQPQTALHPELTSQQEGEVLHAIMWAYFSAKQKTDVSAICQQYFVSFSKQFDQEILAPDRLRIEQIVNEFLMYENPRILESSFQPRFFELGFGKEEPFYLKLGGRKVQLKGKVDRVDVDENNKTFKIIDYKSGSQVPSTKEVEQGRHFQLVVYAIAVEQLHLKGYLPKGGDFLRLKDCDVKKGFEVHSLDAWNILKEKTISNLFDVLSGIERLEFEPTPQKCYSNCDLKRTCEENESAN